MKKAFFVVLVSSVYACTTVCMEETFRFKEPEYPTVLSLKKKLKPFRDHVRANQSLYIEFKGRFQKKFQQMFPKEKKLRYDETCRQHVFFDMYLIVMKKKKYFNKQ